MKKFVAVLALCLSCVFCVMCFTACDKCDNVVGIKKVETDENGNLIIILTDDTEHNVGNIIDKENPQGLDFYLQADDTYAVNIGHARLLPSVIIPKQYKGKEISKFIVMNQVSDDYLPSNRKLYYEGSVSDWLKIDKFDNDVWRYEIYADGTPLSEITELTLQNINIIKKYAFVGFTGLTGLIIPDSITEIDRWAFNGCNSLTAITFNGTAAQWNNITKSSNWTAGSAITQVYCVVDNETVNL